MLLWSGKAKNLGTPADGLLKLVPEEQYHKLRQTEELAGTTHSAFLSQAVYVVHSCRSRGFESDAKNGNSRKENGCDQSQQRRDCRDKRRLEELLLSCYRGSFQGEYRN